MVKNSIFIALICVLMFDAPCSAMNGIIVDLEAQAGQENNRQRIGDAPPFIFDNPLCLCCCEGAVPILLATAGLMAIAANIADIRRINNRIQEEAQQRQLEQARCDRQKFLLDIMRSGSDIVELWNWRSNTSRFGLCNFTIFDVDAQGFTKSWGNNSYVAFLAQANSMVPGLACPNSIDVRCNRYENPPSIYSYRDRKSNNTHVMIVSIKKTSRDVYKFLYWWLYFTVWPNSNFDHKIFNRLFQSNQGQAEAVVRREQAYFGMKARANSLPNFKQRNQKQLAASAKLRRKKNHNQHG